MNRSGMVVVTDLLKQGTGSKRSHTLAEVAVIEILATPKIAAYRNHAGVHGYLLGAAVAWANQQCDYADGAMFTPGCDIGHPFSESADGWGIDEPLWQEMHSELATLAENAAISKQGRELAGLISLRGAEGEEYARRFEVFQTARHPGAAVTEVRDKSLPLPATADMVERLNYLMTSTRLSESTISSALWEQRLPGYISLLFLMQEFGFRQVWQGEFASTMKAVASIAASTRRAEDEYIETKTYLERIIRHADKVTLDVNERQEQFLVQLFDAVWCAIVASPSTVSLFPRVWPDLWLPIAQVAMKSPNSIVRARAERVRDWAVNCMNAEARIAIEYRRRKHRYIRSILLFCLPLALMFAFLQVWVTDNSVVSAFCSFALLAVIAAQRRKSRFEDEVAWPLAIILASVLILAQIFPTFLYFWPPDVFNSLQIPIALGMLAVLIHFPIKPKFFISDLFPEGALPSDVSEQVDDATDGLLGRE